MFEHVHSHVGLSDRAHHLLKGPPSSVAQGERATTPLAYQGNDRAR
jgi:hypothetical protein